MKIKTAELTGEVLDWAVAHVSGMTSDGGKPASYADVQDIPVPFTLFEVIHHFTNDEFSHCSISEIVVTRCGVNQLAGATAPSIDFTADKGRKACGSIGDFFLSRDEATKEVHLVEAGGTLDLDTFKPSTDWSQGGEIIQREKITIVCAEGDYNPRKSGTPDCYDTYWVADKGRLTTSTVYGSQGDDFGNFFQVDCNAIRGSTPLIAAMRCYVLSRLGEEVEIPEDFIG